MDENTINDKQPQKHHEKKQTVTSLTQVTGSREARRQVSVILEVLAGERTTTEATQALEISLPRYYHLESRFIQGAITALEPRPRGRTRSFEAEVETLKRDIARLNRELARSQSLLRSAHRTLGLPSLKKTRSSADSNSKKRKRKPSARAGRVVAVLRKEAGERDVVLAAVKKAAKGLPAALTPAK